MLGLCPVSPEVNAFTEDIMQGSRVLQTTYHYFFFCSKKDKTICGINEKLHFFSISIDQQEDHCPM